MHAGGPERGRRDAPSHEELDRGREREARQEKGDLPGLQREAHVERDHDEDQHGHEPDRGEALPDDVLRDRVVDRMERPYQARRELAHPDLELELVLAPGRDEVHDHGQDHVVRREIGRREGADGPAARDGHRAPRGQEDDRPHDREEEIQEHREPVLRRDLQLR